MSDLTKQDVKRIGKITHWKQKELHLFLKDYIYPNTKNWIDFSKLITLILGIGLFCIGVVFFFAYNWNAIHKFGKIALVFVLLLAFTIASVLPNISEKIKQITLTAASLMVGVLFAVYGQVYQTGANAYDFFLAWAVFSFLWVLVAKYRLLWLLYFCLLNTLLYFFIIQKGLENKVINKAILFFFILLNVLPVLFEYLCVYFKKLKSASYLSYIFAIITSFLSTIILCISIAEFKGFDLLDLIGIVMLAYLGYLLFFYKKVFYAIILSLCTLSIVLTFIISKLEIRTELLLLITLVVVAYITASTKMILKLQNKWKNESKK